MNKPIVGMIRRRFTVQMLFMKLSSVLFILNIMLKIAPPNKETLEELLELLDDLRIKLSKASISNRTLPEFPDFKSENQAFYIIN